MAFFRNLSRIFLWGFLIACLLPGDLQADAIDRLYFPHIASNSQWETELSVINADPSDSLSGTWRFLDGDGNPAAADRAITLSPHQRYAIRVGESLSRAGAVRYAVLEFDPPTPAAAGYQKFFTQGKYRVAVPAVQSGEGGGALHIPHIATSAPWWTGISLVNTADTARSLQIRFSDGTVKPISLAPKQHLARTVRQLYGSHPPPTVVSGFIPQADGIIGLVLFGSQSRLSGVRLNRRTAKRLYYPHIASDDSWWTGLLAYNPHESSLDIRITPFTETGIPLPSTDQVLAGHGKYIGTAKTLGFSPQARWFRVDSTAAISGFELFGTHDQQLLAGYASPAIETTNGLFAKLEPRGWTGIAMVNPLESAQNVLLTAYTDGGEALAFETLPIKGLSRRVDMAEKLFDRAIDTAGYLEFQSDSPVVAFQLNGDNGGDMLDGLPALAVSGAEKGDFPKTFIRNGWDRDRHITELVFGEDAWGVVLSEKLPFQDNWYTDNTIPEQSIADDQAEGMHISHLVYGDGIWAAVMSDEADRSQVRTCEATFPAQFVEEQMANGFRITDIAHGQGQWSVVLSQGTGISEQTWELAADFPWQRTWSLIQQGYQVSELSHGNGLWAVVFSKGREGAQSFHFSRAFPMGHIQEKWAEGFRITELARGRDQWAVVMSQNTGIFGQMVKSGYQVDAVASECSTQTINKYLYRLMKDRYLWYEQVPDLDYTAYSSPEALLDALLYAPKDRWSYIRDATEFESYYQEGMDMGLGFAIRYDEQGNRRIRYVYKDSPAGKAGLERGDITLAINGKTIQAIRDQNLWDTIHGPDEEGTPYHLKIRDSQGELRDVHLTKAWFPINTVLHHEVMDIDGIPTGYLAFRSFLYTSKEELAAVFETFADAGVCELILDLRYNSGGSVYMANLLASRIGGSRVRGQVFRRYIYNERHANWNESNNFLALSPSLDLSRLIVITSSYTCSASELLINSLRPFLDIYLVGERTCGKPVGMNSSYKFCGKQFVTVTFQAANAHGNGDYFDGFAPDCPAPDDLSRAFGDPAEASLRAAIHYIRFGDCLPEPRRGLGSKGVDNRMNEPDQRLCLAPGSLLWWGACDDNTR